MALDWIICSREARLPQPDLLAQALSSAATTAVPRPADGDETVGLDLAFEKCTGSLEFRLTPDGVPVLLDEVPVDVRNDMAASRLAARWTVSAPRGRERHGVLWGIRVAGVLSDHLEGPVIDLRAERAWRVRELKDALVGRAFDAKNHVRIVEQADERGRIWASTRGLGALGQPELILPGIRPQDSAVGAALLLFVAEQEIGRAELTAGSVRGLRTGGIVFTEPSELGVRAIDHLPSGLVIVPSEGDRTEAAMDRLMLSLASDQPA